MNPLTPELSTAGLLRYVVFLFSTTCHEAAHALAAKWGGDLTAFHGGQVTLSPWPHIRREPFGMVLFPLISLLTGNGMFGWASAPYDPYWQQYPKRAAWMSLAVRQRISYWFFWRRWRCCWVYILGSFRSRSIFR